MALSTYNKMRYAAAWPLGCITVAANGTPVNIMNRVDANNVNAPWTSNTGANNNAAEYSPRCGKVFVQAMVPAANNNGMVPTQGNVYVLLSAGPGGGAGPGNGSLNRTDSGAMIMVLTPGAFAELPALALDNSPISPYQFSLDVDVNGDGALVTLVGVVS